MGLFGDQDAAEVSDNPFFVDEGVYESVLTSFELNWSEEKEKHSLVMAWTIEDENENDGEYEGAYLSEWVTAHILADDRAKTPPQDLRRDDARVKQRLHGIGMSDAEINDLVDDEGNFDEELAEKYVGTRANVQVRVSEGKEGTKNEGIKFSNVQKVSPIED